MIKFTTILWHIVDKLDISAMEYVICDTVYQLATNPNSTFSGWCYMSRAKMAERYGLTTRGLQKLITRLEDKGLIIKDKETNYLKPTPLWCETYQGVNKVPVKGEQSSGTHEQSSDGGGEQSSYNKDSIDKYIYKESYKEPQTPFQGDSLDSKKIDSVEPEKKRRQSTPRPKFEPDLSELDEHTKALVLEWMEYRKNDLKEPVKSQRGVNGFLNKLSNLAENYNHARELVDHMMGEEWKTVYPIPKLNKPNGKSQESNDEYKQKIYGIAGNAIAGAEKSKLEREERERRQRESGQKY